MMLPVWLALVLSPATEPADQSAEVSTVSATSPRDTARWMPGFGGEVRFGYSIVTKNGVPNALRIGGAFGPNLLRAGPFELNLRLAAAFGSSEQFGYSYRLGGDVEAGIGLPRVPIRFYLSTGGHFFRSDATENRAGGLWRGAVGLRFLTRRKVYVGVEPFAIERLPDGPGPYTPLRSRWAFEITFLTVGYRP